METKSVNILEIGIKSKSKSEMYRTLTILRWALFAFSIGKFDGVYIRHMLLGRYAFYLCQPLILKQAILSNEVKICKKPQIKVLRASNFVQFITRDLDPKEYLSSSFVDSISNRSWLCNISIVQGV